MSHGVQTRRIQKSCLCLLLLFMWMCAGLVQWQSLASINTRIIYQETKTLSPGSLLLFASERPGQVSALSLRNSISDTKYCADVSRCKHFSLHSPPTPLIFSAIKEFVLIPQHTTPSNTTKELDALYDVLQHVKKMWRTEVEAHVINGNKCSSPLLLL